MSLSRSTPHPIPFKKKGRAENSDPNSQTLIHWGGGEEFKSFMNK